MVPNVYSYLSWFLDLDGVCADFDKKFLEVHGKLFREFEDADAWNRLKAIPDFWLQLEPMPDVYRLWFYLKNKGVSPIFLSSPGTHDETRARYQKRLWVDRHFGKDTPLLLRRRADKQLFAAPDSVLIDDWGLNIEEWTARGGIGIRHVDAETTIAELDKIPCTSLYLQSLRDFWAAS